jgi:PKD repeat protein
MKARVIVFLLMSIVLLSCKSGDSGTDNGGGTTGETYDAIKTSTITSTGGTVEATDLAVTIPPNAVTGSVTVSLSSAQKTLDAPMSVSKLYKIETTSSVGLSYIRVKYSGTLSGENYIVWQEDNYIKSANKVASAKYFIPARDSSGYLVAKLSGITTPLGKSSFNSTANASGLFYALTGQGVLNSGSHFKVYYPTANSSQAQDLAAYLETAYTLLGGYGFNFIGRDWPADIYLQKFDGWLNSALGLDNNAYGYYMTTTKNPLYIAYRTNNCAMYFNLNLMGNPDEMRATAGHEFFHAVQDLYDPRDASTKKWSASSQTWLDEASAVWFEEKMNTGSILPVSLSGNELAFTEGMHVTGSNAQNHGYGMAPMIKYIVSQKGASALATIYTKINTGLSPVEAVFSTMNPTGGTYNTDWYNNFLKSYLTGGIYSIPTITLGSVPTNRRYESKALTDTLCTFPSVAYPDFSGQLYFVSLTYSDISTKSVSVNFKTNSSTSKVHLFQYANSSNALLKSGSNGEVTLTAGEVKSALTAGGGKLLMLALVTNNDYNSGFQGSKNIQATVKINYNAGPTITLQPDYWEGGVNETKMFSLNTANLPQSYRFDWTWGDGSTESTTTPGAAHSYSSAGIYTINVNLVDLELGQIVTSTTGMAKVSNSPAYINPTNSEGLSNTAYQWNIVTDYTLPNARYEWDFGDGSSKVTIYNSKTAAHTYTSTGNYTIKVDIYDNSTGTKIESPSTTFKVSEVSALLTAIRGSAGIQMDCNVKFSNGSETDGYTAYYMAVSNFNIEGVLSQTFTWTGINTFTATRTEYSGSTPTTITVNGTVSMDGQSVTLDWLDHSAGVGSYSWYLTELKVSLQNVPLSGTDGSGYTAEYTLNNSTQFTGYYKKSEVIEPHGIKTYNSPVSSTIKIQFVK